MAQRSLHYYVYDYEGKSVSTAKTKPRCLSCGVLYNWEAAKTACPSGWHLSSDAEWKVLETYLGMSQSEADDIGRRLYQAVDIALKSFGSGRNSSGFSAFHCGRRTGSGGFYGIGNNYFFLGTYHIVNLTYFWTSSSLGDTTGAWARWMENETYGVSRDLVNDRSSGFSVRCLRD